MSFYLAVGDSEPGMILDALDSNGLPENLIDATAFHLRWHKPDGTSVDVALTIVSLAVGSFVRHWTVGDSAIAGVHAGQIIVTRGSGGVEAFPRDGLYYYWTVTPRL